MIRPAPASGRGRRRPQGRLAAVAEAAVRVFTRQGWRLAQVADVAAEAGVATGTIYLYAADKQALLDLAIRAAARLDLPGEAALPAGADMAATLRGALGQRLALPRLAAVADGGPMGPETLARLLAEVYDLLARERRLVLLLDRLSPELPDMAETYGQAWRAPALGRFAAAIARLAAAGHARRDLDAEAASRAVIEMLAWMAMRRTHDPLPPAGDEAVARATALALAEAALAPVAAAGKRL
ncbi:TetR family transcriptional regulator [Stella humosa]|uniref:TetR family transcriptional regulator n=2 Tax=Stella humosa TaxID=94 RepID=A0A3N1KYR6_9PROT|nr:TetR family transcriptional regulator [Stella humosa]